MKNLVLQEWFGPGEEIGLERALVDVLSPVAPSQGFVNTLYRDLLEEAAHQQKAQEHFQSSLRTLGLLGGGLVSIVGGVVIWALWQNHHNQSNVKSAASALPAEADEVAAAQA